MAMQQDRDIVTRRPTLYLAIDLAGGDSQRHPVHMRRLAAAAVAHPDSAAGIDAALFHGLGLGVDPSADLPVAAVTRLLLPSMPADRWWIRADPVCFHVDGDSVLLLADLTRDISDGEREALAAVVSPLFAEVGMELQAALDGWFISAGIPAVIATSPLEAVLGQPVFAHLPRGPDGPRWRQLMNEVQMMLHDVDVNRVRGGAGKSPVNGLWFWGGGRLPVPTPAMTGPITVWSDTPTGRGLAHLLNAASRSSPEDATSWLAAIDAGYHVASVAGHAADDIAAADTQWFAPLWHAVRAGRIASLTVNPLTGIAYTIAACQRRSWWRFWRPA